MARLSPARALSSSSSRPGPNEGTTSKRPPSTPGIILRGQGCGRMGVTGGLSMGVGGVLARSSLRIVWHASDDDQGGEQLGGSVLARVAARDSQTRSRPKHVPVLSPRHALLLQSKTCDLR